MKSKLFMRFASSCTAVGDSFRFSFHHDPDQGLRAGGAYQDAAIPASALSPAAIAFFSCTRAHDRLLLGIIRNRYIYLAPGDTADSPQQAWKPADGTDEEYSETGAP